MSMRDLRWAFTVVCVALLIAGCIHLEPIGRSPIEGRIVTPSGEGVSDVMIWLTYTMPGGLIMKAPQKAFGPYFTDRDGYFHVPEHPFRMLQTWTTFDGDRAPFVILVHPTRGSQGAPTPVPGRPYTIHWRDSKNPAYSLRMIDILPESAQQIAWKYVGGRRD